MEFINEILEMLRPLAFCGDILRGLFGLTALYGIKKFIQAYFYKKVKLSIGTFRIRRKDYDVQKITNVVSACFYDGAVVPNEIRKEILSLTMPKIKELKQYKTEETL